MILYIIYYYGIIMALGISIKALFLYPLVALSGCARSHYVDQQGAEQGL